MQNYYFGIIRENKSGRALAKKHRQFLEILCHGVHDSWTNITVSIGTGIQVFSGWNLVTVNYLKLFHEFNFKGTETVAIKLINFG